MHDNNLSTETVSEHSLESVIVELPTLWGTVGIKITILPGDWINCFEPTNILQ